jgi:hypothetical protein
VAYQLPETHIEPKNGYKLLQPHDRDEQPESERTQRHIQRLLKAGFIEVEPVGSDWQFFAFCERLRNMTPYEIARDWQEYQREARARVGLSEKSVWEALGDFAFELFDLMMRLLLGLPGVQEEKEGRDQPEVAV